MSIFVPSGCVERSIRGVERLAVKRHTAYLEEAMVYYRVSVFIAAEYVERICKVMVERVSANGKVRLVRASEHGDQGNETVGMHIESVCSKSDLSAGLGAITEAYPQAASTIEVIELSSWSPYTIG